MIDLKPEIRWPRRIEIWGITAIAGFNFYLLTSVVAHASTADFEAHLLFWLALVWSQLCFVGLCCVLLKTYSARAGIDEMRDAVNSTNKTLEIMSSARNEELRDILEALSKQITQLQEVIQKLERLKGDFPGLKNLPPL